MGLRGPATWSECSGITEWGSGASAGTWVCAEGRYGTSSVRLSYLYGDTVVLKAVPDPEWFFDNWSDGLSGKENPDTVVMASDTLITATFGYGTGIETVSEIKVLTVRQNYPNPFAGTTHLDYGLPKSTAVEIVVYDVAGRRVFSKRVPNASGGWNRFLFEGLDQSGHRLPSGVYFYRVKTDAATVTRKMVILR